MPARRHLRTVAALGMALAPVILPAHMQPTLIGRRAAMEIVERVDQHTRDLVIESTQAHQARSV